MQAFTLSLQSDGWHITNGAVDFGPYSSQEKASASAAELTQQSLRRAARRAMAAHMSSEPMAQAG